MHPRINMCRFTGFSSTFFAIVAILQLPVTQVTGMAQGVNQAIRFDGTQSVKAASEAVVDFRNTSFTVEFWAKRDRVGSDDFIFSTGLGETDKGLHLGFRSNGKFTLGYWNDDLDTTAAPADLYWHHWAGVFDLSANRRTIYRDGIPVVSDTPSAAYAGTPAVIQIGGLMNDSKLKGRVDEIRIWNVARSASDIAASMAIGAVDPSSIGLIRYWNLESLSGGKVSAVAPTTDNLVLPSNGAQIITDEFPVFASTFGSVDRDAVVTVVDNFRKTDPSPAGMELIKAPGQADPGPDRAQNGVSVITPPIFPRVGYTTYFSTNNPDWALRLTTAGVSNQNNTIRFASPGGDSNAFTAFDAGFDFLLWSPSTPTVVTSNPPFGFSTNYSNLYISPAGSGISFNYGDMSAGATETGISKGFSVSITPDDAGTANDTSRQYVRVYYNGVKLAEKSVDNLYFRDFTGSWRIRITVAREGLASVRLQRLDTKRFPSGNIVAICDNVPLPWAPVKGWQFGFGGRGLRRSEEALLDNISIYGDRTPAPPAGVALVLPPINLRPISADLVGGYKDYPTNLFNTTPIGILIDAGTYPNNGARLLFDTTFELPLNGSMSFNGTSDGLQVPPIKAFNDGTFTIEAWVYARSVNRYARVLHASASPINGATLPANNNNGVILALDDGDLSIRGIPALYIYGSDQGVASTLDSDTPLPLNKWVHLAAVVDGKSARMYMNGRLVGSRNDMVQAPSIDRNVALIGSSPWQSGDLANVVVDELRIWDTALPRQQIQSWMFSEARSNHPNYSHLKNYWNFTDSVVAAVDKITGSTASVYGSSPTPVAYGPPISSTRTVTYSPLVPTQKYGYISSLNITPVGAIRPPTSPSMSFTTPIPSLNPISSRVVTEDAGVQTVAVTGVGYGGTGPNSLPPPGASELRVTATNDNPTLLPPNLFSCIYTNQDDTATLVFASAPNAFGTARITVTVSYTYNGGKSTASVQQIFTLAVTPVNDLPSGGFGSALQLGNGQQLVVPAGGSKFDASVDELTLNSWIKWQLPQPGNSLRLLAFPTDSDLSVQVATGNGNEHTISFKFGDAIATYTPPPERDLASDFWEHWAFIASRSGNYLRIVRNGIVVAQSPFENAPTPGSVDLVIGDSAYSATSTWSEFQLWKTARDPAAIQQTMYQPITGLESDLVIYYRFNEGISPGSVFAKDWARQSDAPNQWGPQDAMVMGVTPGQSARFVGSSAFSVAGQPIRIPVSEAVPTPIYLPGFDVETPLTNLVFTIVTPPAHGKLANQFPGANGPYWVYTADRPASLYSNQDFFVYQITDGAGAFTQQTVFLSAAEINVDPTISLIPNQSVLQDSNNAVSFVIFDQNPGDVPGLAQRLVFQSSDRQILNPETSFLFSVANQTNVLLNLVPVPDANGTANVIVRLTDGRGGSAQAIFTVKVEPKPYYAIMDLGERTVLSGNSSIASSVNDAGIVAGYGARDILGGQRGFLSTFGSDGWVSTAFNGLAGAANDVRGLNNIGQYVGSSDPTGLGIVRAYLVGAGGTNDLGAFGGAGGTATSIGDSGLVTGWSPIAANDHAFRYLTNLVDLHLTPGLAGMTSSRGQVANVSNWIAGIAWNSTVTNAFVFDGATTRLLSGLPGAKSAGAYGMNSFSVIVGWSGSSSLPGQAVLWDPSGKPTALGGLSPLGSSTAYAINDFSQVVGSAEVPGDSDPHAFIYTAGTMYDLNRTLPEENRWKLTRALSINRSGLVAGEAKDPQGRARAFLALPGNIIGRPVARPQGAVARIPEIEILAPENVSSSDAFLWNNFQKRLFAVRPCLARIKWFTSTNDYTGSGSNIVAITDRIPVISTNMWPRNPTVHVATVPVNVEPVEADLPVAFQSMLYATTLSAAVNTGVSSNSGTNASVDSATKLFGATAPGYSVLHYLRKGFANIVTTDNSPTYLDVVRTVDWDQGPFNDPTPVTWPVGTTLGNTNHFDFAKRTGWVLRENSFYDGVGSDAAYQRKARTGVIIPVNAPDQNAPSDKVPAETNAFVVVWFRTNALGIPWGNLAIRYGLQWPDNTTNVIVIASGLGTGPLDPQLYPDQQIYNQADPSLPGYNPNEEHAMFAPSSTGQAMFAIRSDLNDRLYVSRPYALLKYRDAVTRNWKITPYKVVATNSQYRFSTQAEAGKELQPFSPLNVLQTCDASYYSSGPGWRDYNSRIYAMAAGPNGTETNIVVRWYYPLQPAFFWDWNLDGKPDDPPGTCEALLNRLDPNSRDTSIPVAYTFRIRWPDAPPVLQIGQTLLTSTTDAYGRGLPNVYNMASAQIVYDNVAGTNQNTAQRLARFYDPISARTVPNVALPTTGGIATINRNGKLYFPQLPPSLAARLYYDPNNRALGFQGVYDTQLSQDAPILMVNVMSSRDLARILSLADQASSLDRIAWGNAVNQLYSLTRNPNQVSLRPDCAVDDTVLVGLDWKYLTNFVSDAQYALYGQPGQPTLRQTLGFGPCTMPFSSKVDYRVTNVTLNSSGQVTSNVVTFFEDVYERAFVGPEQFGSGPKALAAGGPNVPDAQPMPLNMLRYNGSNSVVQTTSGVDLTGGSFTVEFWAKLAAIPASGKSETVVSLGTPSADGELRIGWLPAGQFAFDLGTNAAQSQFRTAGTERPSDWNHYACVFDSAKFNGTQFIYRNGLLLQLRTNVYGTRTKAFFGSGRISVGGGNGGYFRGDLDEFRLWKTARVQSDIARDMRKRLNGTEGNLNILWHFDEGSGSTTANSGRQFVDVYLGNILGTPNWVTSDVPAAIPPRFLTIAENNDPSLPGLPVNLKVIQVDDGPYVGSLKTIDPGNVFDERLTIRHSSDFGADPDAVQFEWYYRPISTGVKATDLPLVKVDGSVTPNGWIYMGRSAGPGFNEITLGEGGETSLLALSDNFIIGRYRGYSRNAVETNLWSDWVGQEPGRAKLTAGWVTRVLSGLNAFDARTSNFHTDPINTFSSMLVQAGRRYEGDIAFSVTPENLNSVGLIESYETVLRRAQNLSINGAPRVDFDPANKAILRVTSSISDFYVLLGNEAYADAQDPTIGFGTVSATSGSSIASVYGSLASSIFCFQNQVPSLLDEELALLRGRSDESDSVSSPPVYNRLFWNFTQGDGEVAYQQNYNIKDVNNDGFIDVADARILYPQGHGDAWGHYLTALTHYYDLLQNPYFTWVPRPGNISVAGTAVSVDFLDERKFAQAAAAKAQVGVEIVNSTYRRDYVEDPNGQWQGYKDIDTDRAWGVTEWARRASMGAYFDWITANTILPSSDPDPTHTGIFKVDRQTVVDIGAIPPLSDQIQDNLDKSDLGLNPLGIAQDTVPFDIDPAQVAAGSTHFEQIYSRALGAVNNAVAVWNDANRSTQLIRQNQDSIQQFSKNVQDQDRDFKNRLIEIFGYPYAGDIGAGRTYASGYDGPDLYHYNYIDSTALGTGVVAPTNTLRAYFKPFQIGLSNFGFTYKPDGAVNLANQDTSGTNEFLAVDFPLTTGDWSFAAPAGWGNRRAPGEIQNSLSDLLQNQARLRRCLIQHDNALNLIADQAALIQARYDLRQEEIQLSDLRKVIVGPMVASIIGETIAAKNLRSAGRISERLKTAAAESLPKVVGLATDSLAPARGAVFATSAILLASSSTAASILEGTALFTEKVAIPGTEMFLASKLTTAKFTFEQKQMLLKLEELIRAEEPLRAEAQQLQEVIRQNLGRFRSAVATGERLLDQRRAFAIKAAAETSQSRFQDMTFRVFRNDALQKYRATFDLAQTYAYLSAKAYDYETCLLRTDSRAGGTFLTDIISQRAIGQMNNGAPVSGPSGLADSLARMGQNFQVLKTQLGFNNPETETGRFSLRGELYRIGASDDDEWQNQLRRNVVSNVWDIPEFRRYCRPFAPESAGPQPALVFRFPTTVVFGRNYFGWPLGGGDSAYDSSRFATRIRSVGVWFGNYNGSGLSLTPRVYLVPVGMDVLRPPAGGDFTTRQWRVLDQALPVPFLLGSGTIQQTGFLPSIDSLGGTLGQSRQFSSFRAYHDGGSFDTSQVATDSRLIGRSVWNTDWMLVVPGGTLLANPNAGLDGFIASVKDVKLFFQTYSYSGN